MPMSHITEFWQPHEVRLPRLYILEGNVAVLLRNDGYLSYTLHPRCYLRHGSLGRAQAVQAIESEKLHTRMKVVLSVVLRIPTFQQSSI